MNFINFNLTFFSLAPKKLKTLHTKRIFQAKSYSLIRDALPDIPERKTGEHETLKGTIIIDRELCKECHLCIYACKKGCIIPSKEYNSRGYRPVSLKEGEGCTGCTLCAITCPEIAIEVYRE
jgi:2-oxoglutarate ferredoxin oxidoreductase subunit delta